MKKPYFILIFTISILSGIVISGCSPIFYAPNAHNVPLLSEKHELRATGAFAVTNDLQGPEVQMAYAIGENIGLIGNGIYLENSSGRWNGSGYLIEAGGGYFRPIKENFIVEFYGGAGFSEAHNARQISPYTVLDTKFYKYFFQSAFGFSHHIVDIAISPKVAFIHYGAPFIYRDPVLDANGQIVFDSNGVVTVTTKKQNFLAFEPALTVRAGWKYIKFQIQLSGSVQNIPDSEKMNINVGLSFNLAPRFKKAIP